jgi:hypothetical protein
MDEHTEEYCWRKHPEMRPASPAQMSVDNTSSKKLKEFFMRMRKSDLH